MSVRKFFLFVGLMLIPISIFLRPTNAVAAGCGEGPGQVCVCFVSNYNSQEYPLINICTGLIKVGGYYLSDPDTCLFKVPLLLGYKQGPIAVTANQVLYICQAPRTVDPPGSRKCSALNSDPSWLILNASYPGDNNTTYMINGVGVGQYSAAYIKYGEYNWQCP